jgi:hypothetical protein
MFAATSSRVLDVVDALLDLVSASASLVNLSLMLSAASVAAV